MSGKVIGQKVCSILLVIVMFPAVALPYAFLVTLMREGFSALTGYLLLALIGTVVLGAIILSITEKFEK
jgi:hypothetical protein